MQTGVRAEAQRRYSAKYRVTERAKRQDRNRQYQRAYGISIKEYDEILEMQGGVCAVCGTPPFPNRVGRTENLCVDHNHETGEIRGLVHKFCNLAIAVVEGPLLRSVEEYLAGRD